MDELGTFVQGKFAADIDLQLALFKSVQEGTAQRGASLSVACRKWGSELATKLLASVDDNTLTWQNTPIEGMAITTNPWFLQKRKSADGDQNSMFICSLPPGGEQLKGILRSKPFALPARLDFFLAGHDGDPDKPAQKRNAVRLRTAMTHEILAETFPPRNDTAQPVTWDLSAHAGQQAYFEIDDSDDGNAYAWLAAGRFDPPVLALPAVDPSQVSQRQQAAADLARTLPLPSLEPQLTSVLAKRTTELDSSTAIARALVALRPDENLGALAALVAFQARQSGYRPALYHFLFDAEMRMAARRNLRQVRDAQHLISLSQAAKILPHHVGDPPADAGIDLIED